jgi:hypothetical protein
MNSSEHPSPSRSYIGHIKNGVVVLDGDVPLSEGQSVRVEPIDERPGAAPTLERAREVQRLFNEWTDEDGRLPSEEADRLEMALGENMGFELRSPSVD